MNNGELKQIRKWIQSISDEVKKVDEKLDNHLTTVAKDIAEMKTNMKWLTRFFWLIITPAVGTNMKINIGDTWKDVDSMKINIGDTWKDVVGIKQNIGDVWKDVF